MPAAQLCVAGSDEEPWCGVYTDRGQTESGRPVRERASGWRIAQWDGRYHICATEPLRQNVFVSTVQPVADLGQLCQARRRFSDGERLRPRARPPLA